MIKNKKKKTVVKKTRMQVLGEYARTVAISFSFALVFTVLLSFHARSEMIKNYYLNVDEQLKMQELFAQQLVQQADFSADLKKKSYAMCLYVGKLYEAAHDYKNAQLAYELALSKSRNASFTPYSRLVSVLVAQEKFKDAYDILNSIKDIDNINLIRFKTRAYMEIGDKYYSIGKFLSAAKNYEKSNFYYSKLTKRDKVVEKSIAHRTMNAYIEAADTVVKNGYNSDGVRFLKKAEKIAPDNFSVKYKLAIIYSDLDPVVSLEYFEPLLKKRPQDIDYGVYSKALLKAAYIEDWNGNPTKAKLYRYKIHSVDFFVDRKVVYKNDIDVFLKQIIIKKYLFKYHIKTSYRLKNTSNVDIYNLKADFVLKKNGKVVESVSVQCADKQKPLYLNTESAEDIVVKFGKSIFTKRELNQYTIDIYLYKDSKYKTLVSSMKVPEKTIMSVRDFINEELVPN